MPLAGHGDGLQLHRRHARHARRCARGRLQYCRSARRMHRRLLGLRLVPSAARGARAAAARSRRSAAGGGCSARAASRCPWSLALALLVLIPYAATVQVPWQWDVLWRDGFWKQVSGFTVLALSALILVLSLRKRIRRFTLGDFPVWRVAHAVLGALTLAGLAVHTGGRLGSNHELRADRVLPRSRRGGFGGGRRHRAGASAGRGGRATAAHVDVGAHSALLADSDTARAPCSQDLLLLSGRMAERGWTKDLLDPVGRAELGRRRLPHGGAAHEKRGEQPAAPARAHDVPAGQDLARPLPDRARLRELPCEPLRRTRRAAGIVRAVPRAGIEGRGRQASRAANSPIRATPICSRSWMRCSA